MEALSSDASLSLDIGRPSSPAISTGGVSFGAPSLRVSRFAVANKTQPRVGIYTGGAQGRNIMGKVLGLIRKRSRVTVMVGVIAPGLITEMVQYLLTGGVFGWYPILAAAAGGVLALVILGLASRMTREEVGPLNSGAHVSILEPRVQEATTTMLAPIPRARARELLRLQATSEERATKAAGSPLGGMLNAAKATHGSTARDDACMIVAETALRDGEYETAIKAADASGTDFGRSEALKFVAVSAANAGQFALAAKAANRIPQSYVRDSTTIEILKIQRKK